MLSAFNLIPINNLSSSDLPQETSKTVVKRNPVRLKEFLSIILVLLVKTVQGNVVWPSNLAAIYSLMLALAPQLILDIYQLHFWFPYPLLYDHTALQNHPYEAISDVLQFLW